MTPDWDRPTFSYRNISYLFGITKHLRVTTSTPACARTGAAHRIPRAWCPDASSSPRTAHTRARAPRRGTPARPPATSRRRRARVRRAATTKPHRKHRLLHLALLGQVLRPRGLHAGACLERMCPTGIAAFDRAEKDTHTRATLRGRVVCSFL